MGGAAEIRGFTGRGGQAGDSEMRLRSAGETLAGKNQYYSTLFTLHHSHRSHHAAVSFSPLQKVLVNNSNLNVLFCFFSICSEASNDTAPSKRHQLITAYLHYVQIKQNLRTMLDNRQAATLTSPAHTSNEDIFKYSAPFLPPLELRNP